MESIGRGLQPMWMWNVTAFSQRAEFVFAILAFLAGVIFLLALPLASQGWEPGVGGALLYDLFFLLSLLGIAAGGWSHVQFGYGLSLLVISWLALLLVFGLWRVSLLIPSLLLGVAAILAAGIRSSTWSRT